MSAWVGFDRGDSELAHADRSAIDAAGRFQGVQLVTTHVVDGGGGRHYACAVALDDVPQPSAVAALVAEGYSVAVLASQDWTEDGPAVHRGGAKGAAAQLRDGHEGRAVWFRGWDKRHGTVTVAEITNRTAIDRVEALGGGIDDTSSIVTGEHLRPLVRAGQLILAVTPLAAGGFQPFERRTPHRCCQDN